MKKTYWKASVSELNSVRTITTSAMLIAMAVVLSYFTITASEYLKIGLAYLPKEIMAALFGPIVGAIGNGIVDIVQFVLKPTGPYFFGWTFNSMLVGFFGGIFLYRKPPQLWRVFLVNGFELLVNVGLGTLWISLLYGQGFWVLFPMRVLKNLIQYPINVLLFYMIWKLLDRRFISKERL